MLTATQFSNRTKHTQMLCLGIVCIAEHERLATALEQLQAHGEVTVGLAQGNRIPACVFTPRGQDKALLAELESLDGIMTVEVAYAHTIEEDEVQ
tara:strand:- start:74427 stop:74711 length:285 start_codon:yes stop_codon:yes gene_type:complete